MFRRPWRNIIRQQTPRSESYISSMKDLTKIGIFNLNKSSQKYHTSKILLPNPDRRNVPNENRFLIIRIWYLSEFHSFSHENHLERGRILRIYASRTPRDRMTRFWHFLRLIYGYFNFSRDPVFQIRTPNQLQVAQFFLSIVNSCQIFNFSLFQRNS